MSVLVTGSVAVDHIMVFEDHFKNHFVSDKLEKLNVAFHVPEMTKKYGGTGGNIAYNLARLGVDPLLLAAVGPDALLLKFSERQGGLRAADLRFLSCYPAEAEHVWPPMTHLQPTGNMEVVRLPALGDAKFTVVEVEPRAASTRHTM